MAFSLDKYLRFIGILPQFVTTSKPSIESLFSIVNKHVMKIPYQNFHLFFKEKTPLYFSISVVSERLIDRNEGGMCYETSELLYHALHVLGFSIKRVAVFTLNNKPFNPAVPSNHNISVIEIGNRYFITDVGFGYNSLRYPLEIKLNESYEYNIFPGEKYQLISNEDHYQLNAWQKNSWFSFYRFNRPLEFINFENTNSNYLALREFPGVMPIRDLYIKSGLITAKGRECFHYEPTLNSLPNATRISVVAGKEVIYHYKNFAEFKRNLELGLGLNTPNKNDPV